MVVVNPFQPNRIMPRIVPREGVCPACQEYKTDESMEMQWGPFVRHHWYEPDGSKWKVYICRRCNVLLRSNCSIALGEHVFSSWEVQIRYVRELLGLSGETVQQESILYVRVESGRTVPRLPRRSWMSEALEVLERMGYGGSQS